LEDPDGVDGEAVKVVNVGDTCPSPRPRGRRVRHVYFPSIYTGEKREPKDPAVSAYGVSTHTKAGDWLRR